MKIIEHLRSACLLGFGFIALGACSVSTSETDVESESDALNAPVACGGVLKQKGSTTAKACLDNVCARSNGGDAGTLSSCGSTSKGCCSDSSSATSCAGTGAPDSCGYEWQCVELVNRYMHVVFGDARVHGDAGCPMCENFDASSAYDVHYKSSCGGHPLSNYKPVQGDALVWAGHTAIVTSTTATSIHYMQQNAGDYYGTNSVSWSTSTNPDTFGAIPGQSAACVIHEKSNVCKPGDTTASGCASGFEKTCGAKHAWGACECVPGSTRTCVSPDCCGTCGHKTDTCSASHTWTAGICQNGC